MINKLLLAFLLSITTYTTVHNEFLSLFKATREYLYSWQIGEATKTADRLLELAQKDEEKALAYYLKSEIEFHRGEYKKAQDYITQARNLAPEDKDINYFLTHIKDVIKTAGSFKEVQTKHFIIRYVHPKDQILALYAKEVLESSYHEIGFLLETYPDEPVVVEVYPDLKSFTTASTLSLNDIKTTGVVGICKFNRIMILSPRLLPKGYRWSDTLAHEYTHYLLFIRSKNTIPVWLHEGIAKFYEKRWRQKHSEVLNPLYETILARALKDRGFVPIEKMHPSLGKLQNAYEAQLAFAQVGTMIEFLTHKWGSNAVVKLVDKLKETRDYKLAIKEITQKEFDEFYNLWIGYLNSKKLKEKIPSLSVKELEFVQDDKDSQEDESKELAYIEDTMARRYTKLGDMLRERNRLKAALYEYEKAISFDPLSPVILHRLGLTKAKYGEYEEAEKLFRFILDYYPDSIEAYINLGRIYLKQGKVKGAEKLFREALQINPYDPEIHIELASIYQKQNKKDLEEQEKLALEIILKED